MCFLIFSERLMRML